ncbi:hypothetical protein ACIBG7_43110 [Nonomuraea sp. NPDC050328]|uniref:hypothetical protein n=1 Tax=Nonomuraea sp. NPDC050328 TaxID=3364361 RepID=UPI00379141B6
MSSPPHIAGLPGKAAALDRRAEEIEPRGAEVLRAVADAYRQVVAIYASDPTLNRCPAGRERDLDLALEIGRQIPYIVRQALEGREPERWPIEDRWAEAEAMAARLPEILDRARAAARPDHATPDGSRAISAMWLRAAASQIEFAGLEILRAIDRARSLPHPAPGAEDLAALARVIITSAEVLRAEREAAQP